MTTESTANNKLVPKCLSWISRSAVHRIWYFSLTTALDSASAQAIFLSSLLKKWLEAGALVLSAQPNGGGSDSSLVYWIHGDFQSYIFCIKQHYQVSSAALVKVFLYFVHLVLNNTFELWQSWDLFGNVGFMSSPWGRLWSILSEEEMEWVWILGRPVQP